MQTIISAEGAMADRRTKAAARALCRIEKYQGGKFRGHMLCRAHLRYDEHVVGPDFCDAGMVDAMRALAAADAIIQSSMAASVAEMIARVRDERVCTDDLHRQLADALEVAERYLHAVTCATDGAGRCPTCGCRCEPEGSDDA